MKLDFKFKICLVEIIKAANIQNCVKKIIGIIKSGVIAKKVEVSFMENQDSFSEKEWKDLYKLSENTFVEETDSLKQGAAGAGLTDNDWQRQYERKRSEGFR